MVEGFLVAMTAGWLGRSSRSPASLAVSFYESVSPEEVSAVLARNPGDVSDGGMAIGGVLARQGRAIAEPANQSVRRRKRAAAYVMHGCYATAMMISTTV